MGGNLKRRNRYRPLQDIVDLALLLRRDLEISHASAIQAVREMLSRLRGDNKSNSDRDAGGEN
jgi:hypothetical protein